MKNYYHLLLEAVITDPKQLSVWLRDVAQNFEDEINRLKKDKPDGPWANFSHAGIKKSSRENVPHVRLFFDQSVKGVEPGYEELTDIVRRVVTGGTVRKDSIPPGAAGSLSDRLKTWVVDIPPPPVEQQQTHGYVENFSIVVSFSGQRAGGLQYEQDIINAFKTPVQPTLPGMEKVLTVKAEKTKSTHDTDIVFKINAGNCKDIKVEVKALTAKYGEPLMYFLYAAKNFVPMKDTPGNKLVQRVLNDSGLTTVDKSDASKSSKAVDANNAWLVKIRDTFKDCVEKKMQFDAQTHALVEDPTDKKTFQLTKADWIDAPNVKDYESFYRISQRAFDALSKNFNLSMAGSVVPVKARTIVGYYKGKGADYLQIQGKGIYSFNLDEYGKDILRLGVPAFSTAIKEINPFVVPNIRRSGGLYVIRATANINVAAMKPSPLSADEPEGISRFQKRVEAYAAACRKKVEQEPAIEESKSDDAIIRTYVKEILNKRPC